MYLRNIYMPEILRFEVYDVTLYDYLVLRYETKQKELKN